jgi:hypothetical protein
MTEDLGNARMYQALGYKPVDVLRKPFDNGDVFRIMDKVKKIQRS